ncbi:MAG: hypothetical protein ACK5JT_23830, partial [Hyphomicrobiaceae bacterium]
ATCSGGTYDGNAMNTLVYGREGISQCGSVPTDQLAGMCDIFWRITPANVIVTYASTGLGFAGRPGPYPARVGGAVPTITVELTGLTFELPFLNGLLGVGNITMPAMRTSATGEDMATPYNAGS